MIRFLYLFFFFGVSSVALSQNIQIEYKVYPFKGYYLGTLVVSPDFSFYEQRTEHNKTKTVSTKEIIDGENVTNIITDFGTDKHTYVIYHNNQSHIKYIDHIGNWNGSSDKRTCYTDEVPQMQWEIHEETKTIEGFTCYRATTEFRGNRFEIWFSPEIPVSQGPWKFNNLPGAILKASSLESSYTWDAIKVSYEASGILLPACEEFEGMSYREFIETDAKLKKEAHISEILKRIQRQSGGMVPRALDIDVSGVNFKTNLLEPKFEWED